MTLEESSFEETIVNHLFTCLTIYFYFLFACFERRESCEVMCNLIEEFAFLFENMQFHSLGEHVIALFHYIFLSQSLGLQRLKEVVFILLCIFMKNLIGKSEAFLVSSLNFFAKSIYRTVIIFELKERVV